MEFFSYNSIALNDYNLQGCISTGGWGLGQPKRKDSVCVFCL